MKTITVIIPNYNGARFLDPCMAALARQTCRDFCVLVVDNGSTDGSVEKIRAWEKTGIRAENGGTENVSPDGRESIPLRGVYLPENTGFSGAVNAGLKETDTEYAVLLNNDTEVLADYLDKMLAVMTEDAAEKVAAVSPLMLSLKDPAVIDSAGDGYCLAGWAFQRGVGRPADLAKFAERTGVFSACAGGAMYRKSALDKVSRQGKDGIWWFDPEHFAYLEDLDVSYRLLLSGFDIVYEPAAKVLHAGSATSGSRYNAFKVRLAARNNVYVNVKNQPFLQLLVNLPFILLGAVIKQIFFLRRGFGKDYFCGFFEGISKIPRVWPHRVHVTFTALPNFFKAELLMIDDTFSYLGDLIGRKIFHR